MEVELIFPCVVLVVLVVLPVVVVVLKVEELARRVELVEIGIRQVEIRAILNLVDVRVEQLLDLVIASLDHFLQIQSKDLICNNI